MGCGNSAEDPVDDDDMGSSSSAKRRMATVDFSGQGLVILPVVPKPNVVKVLHLANNFLTRLPKDLSSWTQLEEVLLASNRFVRIPEGLASVKSLTALDMSNNPLSRTGGYDTLANLPRLKKLSLSMTALRQLPGYLGRCGKLTMLDIGYNQALDLNTGDVLGNLKELSSLSIPYCSLRGIPSSVQSSSSITFLNLTGNSGLDLSPMSAFGNLAKNLEILHLGSCGLRSLPNGLLSLTKLTELHLQQNQYLTSLEGIRALSSLKTLDLSDCALKQLPRGMHDASSLTKLDLGGNEPESLALLARNFPNLEAISVLGSKWAVNCNGDDSLWHEICQVKSLTSIEWQTWGEKGGRFTVSPYTTRFPLPLCSLKVKNMNGIPVREELFDHAHPCETLCFVLNDGYYKVDFGFEPNAFSSHFDALEAIHQRAQDHRELSFYTTTGQSIPGSPLYGSKSDFASDNSASVEASEGADGRLIGVRHRYVLYLYLQTIVFPNNVLMPPPDVATVHYAHMISGAASYREDLPRLLGLDPERKDLEATLAPLFKPKYRRLGLAGGASSIEGSVLGSPENSVPTSPAAESEGKSAATVASNGNNGDNEAIAVLHASRKAWDDFVRAKEEEIGRGITAQFGYDSASLSCLGHPGGGDANPLLAKPAQDLPLIDPSSFSLKGILSTGGGDCHGFKTPLSEMLKDFFQLTSSFTKHRSRYEALNNECLLRYAKFLVLASTMKREYVSCKERLKSRLNGESTVVPKDDPFSEGAQDSSLLPVKNGNSSGTSAESPTNSSTRPPEETKAVTESSQPFSSSPIDEHEETEDDLGDRVMPVPTLGIQLALSLHRVNPKKYSQDLEMLELNLTDLVWETNPLATEKTTVEWSRLFDEPLLQDTGDGDGKRRGSIFTGLPPPNGGVVKKAVMFKEAEGGSAKDDSTPSTGDTSVPATTKTKRRVTITTIGIDHHQADD